MLGLSSTSRRLLIVARAFTNRKLSYTEALAIIEQQLRLEHNDKREREKTLVVIISLDKPMSTSTIASGSADGSKSTVADDRGETQTVAAEGWQDTKDAPRS